MNKMDLSGGFDMFYRVFEDIAALASMGVFLAMIAIWCGFVVGH